MANQQTKDLMSALDEFKKGVEEYNQFQAIDTANQLVQKIRASAENDAAKRAQLQNVANDLVGQMALNNTPATTMQTVAGAIAPKLPGTAEGVALEAATTGNEELLKSAVKADRAIREPREAAALERDLIRLKSLEARQKGPKPISDNQLNKLQEFDDELMTGKSILEQVSADPSLVGLKMRIPGATAAREVIDPKFGAFRAQVGQWFDQYRVRVTGAGASGKELAILEKNRPGIGDTAELFKSKVRAILAIGEQVRNKRIQNLAKAGRDVSQFQDESAIAVSAPPQANRIVKVRQRSTGKFRTAEIGPDGKIIKFLD